MLKTSSSNVDLQLERDNALEKIPKEALVSVQTKKYSTFNIDYPVNKYPEKPKSLNLPKEKSFTNELAGVKGQYLIFNDGTVFNVRSNEGVVIDLEIIKS